MNIGTENLTYIYYTILMSQQKIPGQTQCSWPKPNHTVRTSPIARLCLGFPLSLSRPLWRRFRFCLWTWVGFVNRTFTNCKGFCPRNSACPGLCGRFNCNCIPCTGNILVPTPVVILAPRQPVSTVTTMPT